MLKTLLIALLPALAAAAAPIDLGSGSYQTVGGARLTVADGALTLTRQGNPKESAATRSLKIESPAFQVVKARVKAGSGGGSGKISAIARGEKNEWHFQWFMPEMTELTSEWREVELRFFTPAVSKSLEIKLEVASGTLEVRDFTLTSSAAADSRPAHAPPLEYWINMDYNDNVVYSPNLKLDGYGEAEIAAFFEKCKKAGVTGVQWRISVFGQVAYQSKGAATVFPGPAPLEKLDPARRRMAETLRTIDPLAIAVREARKQNIKILIWVTLSDEGYPDPAIANYCVPQFLLDHPEARLQNREGKYLDGTLCYSVPAAREYRLGMIRELLAYRADGLYLCTRSHSNAFGTDSGDDYGFNAPVVEEYRKRYGVDILTQPFDVAKWREIKSDGYDLLFEEISKLAKAAGQEIRLGVSSSTLANGAFQSNWGKTPVRWQKFLKNRWVDSILDGQYHVEPFFASREFNRFREAAWPDQKFYLWAQMVNYSEKRVYSQAKLFTQAAFFAFLGVNGGVYHEALNLEENADVYFDPIGEFYRKENAR